MRFVRTAENLFGLPAGFQRVEYLESTGTQYIDTWVKYNVNNSYTIKGKFNYSQTDAFKGSGWNAGGCFGLTQTGVISDGSNAQGIDGLNKNVIFTQVINSGSSTYTETNYSVDGSDYLLQRTHSNLSTYAANGGFGLFAIYSTNAYTYFASGKIYYYKISENGTLVRDFIPCIDPLGVACMYDLVGKKPYYNQGTGNFTVGRKVIPVEYLGSDGAQYIDTGFNPTNTSGYKLTYSCSQTSNSVVFGCRSSSGQKARWWTGENNGTYNGFVSNETNRTPYTFNTVRTAENNFYNSRTRKVDGIVTQAISETITDIMPTSVMFSNIPGATTTSVPNKIYKLLITDNNTLVRDYIPCKDENNVGYMFDTLSGTVYLNAGTGAFSVGENKYTSKLRLIKDAIQLPAGYTRVEYLESTGTQYIDTGIKLDNNSSVELDYQLTQAVQNRKGLFGGLGSSVSKRFGALLSPSNSQLESGYGSGNEFYQLGLPDTNRHVLKQEKNLLYFDGSLVYTFNTATFAHDFNAPLGNFSFTNYNPASAKYYRSKWWDNGVLARSFIPVRDENNVGYMFDEVTGQLFGNAGSGSFGIGNDLKKPKVRFIQDVIPSDYLPLKYLESTGTQYIDTGIYGTPELKTILTFQELEINTERNGKAIFGCYYTDNSNNYYLYQRGNVSAPPFEWQAGFGAYANTPVKVDTNKHTAVFENYNLYLDGNLIQAFQSGRLTQTPHTLLLFNMHNANGGTYTSLSKRVYGCVMILNNTLVRDFYPVKRKSDDAIGMYDRVTKQFYGNSGTGSFSYG